MAVNRAKNLDTNLPYELSEIPDHLRCRARTELFEDEETRIHSLKLLRSRLKEEPNLRCPDEDLFLLSFLRARKFDVKSAFQLIKNFFTMKEKHGEIFGNFDYHQDVKRTLEGNAIGFLPYRDSEGSVILILRVSHWHPPEHSAGDLMKSLVCALLHANFSPATQIAGFKIIFDFAGLSLKHVSHIPPSSVWLLTEGLQNIFPGRFRVILLVNENPVFKAFWMIAKNFLTKKIKERIHFCGKNIKKIHNYISPSLLPADYEGELPPYDNTEWRQLVDEKADYFTYFDSFGYTKPRSKSQEKK